MATDSEQLLIFTHIEDWLLERVSKRAAVVSVVCELPSNHSNPASYLDDRSASISVILIFYLPTILIFIWQSFDLCSACGDS